jgi:hypothetical protein
MIRDRLILLFCSFIFFTNISGQNTLPKNENDWLYTTLNIKAPSIINTPKSIVIAVIDDGFRFTHKDLKPFIYSNTKEIPGNNIDDDNNGYIDDYNGWDVSDNDNDASLPAGRESEYYHGTAVAGIITGIFKKVYNTEAANYCKILPIKALSSNSGSTAILEGYKGIKYAIGLHPDIICCAWSGGTPSEEEKSIISEAIRKGIIIIASAGNFSSEKDEYPARLPGVWDIAATDTLNRKLQVSNYSERIDFATPGIKIKAPFTVADNSYFKPDGTSVSVAVMAGCAGLIKLVFPNEKKEIIEEAFKNTAIPVDSINIRYCGKLGAGIPDVEKAIEYISNPENRFTYHNPHNSKGTLIFNPGLKNQKKEIAPAGAYSGIFLHISVDNISKLKGSIKIYNKNTAWNNQSISSLPQNLFIPGSSLTIGINAPSKTSKNLKIQYYPKTIDSTKLYCSDKKYISGNTGAFTDGSENDNYANNCACKWLISAPPGKRIKIEFTEFDTQAKTDFVWLFDGDATIPENIIAKFSGPNIPPTVTSTTNTVLVWFVSDWIITNKGWRLKYEVVD